jgi:hypothetical protein
MLDEVQSTIAIDVREELGSRLVFEVPPGVEVLVVGWPESGTALTVHMVCWQTPAWQAIPGEHARSQVPQ